LGWVLSGALLYKVDIYIYIYILWEAMYLRDMCLPSEPETEKSTDQIEVLLVVFGT
jgi:hypothetical protein